MTTHTIVPEDRRAYLRAWLDDPDVIADDDSIKLRLRQAVAECLRREELEMGMAIIALIATRPVMLHRRACEMLWGLVADRPR